MATVGVKGLNRFVPDKLHTHDNSLGPVPVAITTHKLYKVFSKMTVKCFKYPIFLLNSYIIMWSCQTFGSVHNFGSVWTPTTPIVAVLI